MHPPNDHEAIESSRSPTPPQRRRRRSRCRTSKMLMHFGNTQETRDELTKTAPLLERTRPIVDLNRVRCPSALPFDCHLANSIRKEISTTTRTKRATVQHLPVAAAHTTELRCPLQARQEARPRHRSPKRAPCSCIHLRKQQLPAPTVPAHSV